MDNTAADGRKAPPSEAIKFLECLAPGEEKFTFQTFDDVIKPDGEKRKHSNLVRILHGTLAEHHDTLTRLNALGAGIYITVNQTNLVGREKRDIIKIRANCLDLDGAPLQPVLDALKPTIVVESSPGKFQVYFRVRDEGLLAFTPIQKALAKKFSGDEKVHDLPRVMRLPGYFHMKDPNARFECRIVSADTGVDHAAAEIKAVAGEIEEEEVQQERRPGNDLNSFALGNFDTWVPKIFGTKAQKQSHGGYRVKAKDLGRENLVEDLSFHPEGIKDFAVADQPGEEREGRRTPIDIVMEHSGKSYAQIGAKTTYAEAAKWLTEATGFRPVVIEPTPFMWILPRDIKRRGWLYKPTYVRGFMTMTVGPGGAGKSSLVLGESLAMATGRTLFAGASPEQQLRVWYWNGEDPADELQRRVAAIMLHYQLSEADVADRLFIDSGRTAPIVIAEDSPRGITVHHGVADALIQAITRLEIDVVVIDPFVSSHRVNENDNIKIEQVAKEWSRVAEEANCAVHLVVHSRKTGGASATAEDSRGASALLAAARVGRTFNVMTPEEAKGADVLPERRREYASSEIGKTNVARPPERKEWFHFRSVHLGNGVHALDEGDSVGVLVKWEYPRPEDLNMTPERTARVLAAIKEQEPMRFDAQSRDWPWVGTAVAEALGIDLESALVKKSVSALIKAWVESGTLTVVKGRPGEDRKPRKCVVVAAGP